MNKMGSAQFQNMMQQGRYSLQEVVSGIQEIARVSDYLIKINSLMKSIVVQSNFLSMKALEMVHIGDDAGRGLALVAHEARSLAEFSNKQSNAIGNVFVEIKESLDKISCSTNKVLCSFGEISRGAETDGEQETDSRSAIEAHNASGHALQATVTEQVNKAVEVANELTRIKEDISSLVQSVSRLGV